MSAKLPTTAAKWHIKDDEHIAWHPKERMEANGTRHVPPRLDAFTFALSGMQEDIEHATEHDVRISPQFEALGQTWCLVVYPLFIEPVTLERHVAVYLRRLSPGHHLPPTITTAVTPPGTCKCCCVAAAASQIESTHPSIAFRISSPRVDSHTSFHALTSTHRFRSECGWDAFLSHRDLCESFLHTSAKGSQEFLLRVQLTYLASPHMPLNVWVENSPKELTRCRAVINVLSTPALFSKTMAKMITIPCKHQQIWMMSHDSAGKQFPVRRVTAKCSLLGLELGDDVATHASRTTLFVRDIRQSLVPSSERNGTCKDMCLVLVFVQQDSGDATKPVLHYVGSGEFARDTSLDALRMLVFKRQEISPPTDALPVSGTVDAGGCIVFSGTTGELVNRDADDSADTSSDHTQWSQFGSLEADMHHRDLEQAMEDELDALEEDIDDAVCGSFPRGDMRERMQVVLMRRRRDKLLTRLYDLSHTTESVPLCVVPSNHTTVESSCKSNSDKKRAKRQRQKAKKAGTLAVSEAAVPSPVQEQQLEEAQDSDSEASEIDDDTFTARVSPLLMQRQQKTSSIIRRGEHQIEEPVSPNLQQMQSGNPLRRTVTSPRFAVAGIMSVCDDAILSQSLTREIVGVSNDYAHLLTDLPDHAPIFWFHSTTRVLHGPLYSTGKAGQSLDPLAFPTKTGKRSRFPTQVRVTGVDRVSTLPESEWIHLILGTHRIRALREDEVSELLQLFGVTSSNPTLSTREDITMPVAIAPCTSTVIVADQHDVTSPNLLGWLHDAAENARTSTRSEILQLLLRAFPDAHARAHTLWMSLAPFASLSAADLAQQLDTNGEFSTIFSVDDRVAIHCAPAANVNATCTSESFFALL